MRGTACLANLFQRKIYMMNIILFIPEQDFIGLILYIFFDNNDKLEVINIEYDGNGVYVCSKK